MHLVRRPVVDASCTGELLELSAEVAGVDERADLGAEDEVIVVPDISVTDSLFVLQTPSLSKRDNGYVRDDQCSLGLDSLWFAVAQLVVLSLHGLADVHYRRRCIESAVGPAKAEDLAGSKAAGRSYEDRSFESVPIGGVEELPSVFGW